jgi:hypothetical protein
VTSSAFWQVVGRLTRLERQGSKAVLSMEDREFSDDDDDDDDDVRPLSQTIWKAIAYHVVSKWEQKLKGLQ